MILSCSLIGSYEKLNCIFRKHQSKPVRLRHEIFCWWLIQQWSAHNFIIYFVFTSAILFISLISMQPKINKLSFVFFFFFLCFRPQKSTTLSFKFFLSSNIEFDSDNIYEVISKWNKIECILKHFQIKTRLYIVQRPWKENTFPF